MHYCAPAATSAGVNHLQFSFPFNTVLIVFIGRTNAAAWNATDWPDLRRGQYVRDNLNQTGVGNSKMTEWQDLPDFLEAKAPEIKDVPEG
jgi:hypothetical protein